MKVQNVIITGFLLAFNLSWAQNASFEISRDIFENSSLKFQSHSGPGEYDSYLSMRIYF